MPKNIVCEQGLPENAMVALSALSITLRDILDRVGPALPNWRIRTLREILVKCWQRTCAAFEDWSAASTLFCSELLSRDRPERFLHFCRACGEETPHEGFDELGAGWYAQICLCQRCGRQGMTVWPLAWW